MPILDDKLRDVVNIRFEPHVMVLGLPTVARRARLIGGIRDC
jgi:hypothetical protein